MSKVRVEIVDDNDINVAMLRNIIDAQEDFEVVGMAYSGQEALAQIEECQPDVVLLDIIMPGMDGIAVLEAIRGSTTLKKQPKVLMVTAVGRDDITSQAFVKGADYYIMKPFIASELVKNIKMVLQPQEDSFVAIGHEDSDYAKMEKMVQATLESDIMQIFASLGISTVAGGYRYLVDAVSMAVSEPGVLNRITKDVYPVVAEKHESTKDNVERQIRRAIEIGWKRADLEAINKYFGFTIDGQKGKPTNSEFIAQIADYLRLEYMKQGRNFC